MYSHLREKVCEPFGITWISAFSLFLATVCILCIFFSLSMLPFAIVAFENNGGLAVIPTKWFTGGEEDECYWPPAKINMAKAVAEQLEPHTDWATFKLTVKRKAGNLKFMCIK